MLRQTSSSAIAAIKRERVSGLADAWSRAAPGNAVVALGGAATEADGLIGRPRLAEAAAGASCARGCMPICFT
jgi:hypothetical protein